MRKTQDTARDRQISDFVRNLSKLDDGERARLRRNVGSTLAESRQVRLLFFQKVLPYGVSHFQEEDFFLVATLYPFDKKQRERDRAAGAHLPETPPLSEPEESAESPRSLTLGASFRKAHSDQNATGFDRRIARLLDTDRQQLPFQLRQAIYQLSSAWISIDWAQLARDILNWEHPSRYVQRNWARDYVASKPETN